MAMQGVCVKSTLLFNFHSGGEEGIRAFLNSICCKSERVWHLNSIRRLPADIRYTTRRSTEEKKDTKKRKGGNKGVVSNADGSGITIKGLHDHSTQTNEGFTITTRTATRR